MLRNLAFATVLLLSATFAAAQNNPNTSNQPDMSDRQVQTPSGGGTSTTETTTQGQQSHSSPYGRCLDANSGNPNRVDICFGLSPIDDR